jgi:hypothetical protein
VQPGTSRVAWIPWCSGRAPSVVRQVDIDQTILAELKRLQREEGKSLGRPISDLLARALQEPKTAAAAAAPVR